MHRSLSTDLGLWLIGVIVISGGAPRLAAAAGQADLATQATQYTKEAGRITHFCLGTHGDCSKPDALNGQRGKLGEYECLTFCAGGPGSQCTDVKEWHFDCVGFIEFVVRQLGRHDLDWVGARCGDQAPKPPTNCENLTYTLSNMICRLENHEWRPTENPVINETKRGSLAQAYDASWANLLPGDILIFGVPQEESGGSYSIQLGDGITTHSHSGICVKGGNGSAEAEFVSSRAPNYRILPNQDFINCSDGGTCPVAPDDSGVLRENLQAFMNVGLEKWQFPERFLPATGADSCNSKGHALLMYLRLDQCSGSITVCKYDDLNFNSQADAGEFVPNWPFHISGPGTEADFSTGQDGCTTFANLQPGSYAISERVTADSSGNATVNGQRWRLLSANPQTIQLGCNENSTVRFANIRLGTITAHKFDDTDMNGCQNGHERDIEGWPFTLKGTSFDGSAVDLSGTTGADGNYVCRDLLPSNASGYVLREDPAKVPFVDCKTTFNGQRWMQTTQSETTVVLAEGTDVTRRFGNVQLGRLTVRKFDDADMDAQKASSEPYLPGWPIRLDGPSAPAYCTPSAGDPTPAQSCWPTWPVMKDTEAVFVDLVPGSYTIKEALTWETASPCAADPYTVNRATHQGKRWQATTDIDATLTLDEGAELTHDFGNVCLGTVDALKFWDKNMSGTRQAVAEAFTDSNANQKWDPAELWADINGNGLWDPAEPYTDSNHNGRYDVGEAFTDTNGSMCWDDAEPLRDDNGNGAWDPAEGWVDSFPNGVWDDAEGGLSEWPLALYGHDAAGRCIGPVEIKTAAAGGVTFADIPPGTYRVYENTPWCQAVNWLDMTTSLQSLLNGLPLDARRTTYELDGRRWFATTAPALEFDYAECAASPNLAFGNECTATISGQLFQQDCPDTPATPLEGWTVEMEKHEVEQQMTFAHLPFASTDPDCQNQPWERLTGPDGAFRFGELAPGVYKLRLVVPTGFNQIGDPVDMCVPFRVACEDVEKDLSVRDILAVCDLYQAYPARTATYPDSSVALQSSFRGYAAQGPDPITAVGGVFSIDPGSKWANYINASRACTPYCLKNVTLTKEHFTLRQCTDVFPAGTIRQQGTPGIRTWWPLLYEPPGTKWSLTVLYGTPQSVQLPGETSAGYVHNDTWRWQVKVNLDSLGQLIDVFHSLPFGLDEVPLISNEPSYHQMKAVVAQAKSASTDGDRAIYLSDLELLTMDECISISPSYPSPAGPGTGIANTRENPACCKILADLDYLLKLYGRP